jgi:hypothetical protein
MYFCSASGVEASMNTGRYLSGILGALVLCLQGQATAQGKIAFISVAPGDFTAGELPRTEKHILDIAEGELTVVDEFPYATLGPGRYGGPYYWSPDKTKAIAFTSQGIFVTDAGGGYEISIGAIGDLESAPDPRWSPDGSRIALSQGPKGRRQTYVVDADGGNPTNLSNSSSDDYLPYWSPDGSQIAFTSSRGLDTEVCVMDADGSDKVNLTNHPNADYLPSGSPQGPWSSDGMEILYLSYQEGNSDIYVIDADGGSPINLVEASTLKTARSGHQMERESPMWFSLSGLTI